MRDGVSKSFVQHSCAASAEPAADHSAAEPTEPEPAAEPPRPEEPEPPPQQEAKPAPEAPEPPRGRSGRVRKQVQRWSDDPLSAVDLGGRTDLYNGVVEGTITSQESAIELKTREAREAAEAAAIAARTAKQQEEARRRQERQEAKERMARLKKENLHKYVMQQPSRRRRKRPAPSRH